MSGEGWYPDPGGQPGLYRFWNGTGWTETVTTKPQQTPVPPGSRRPDSPKRKGGAGWWIGAAAAVAVGVLVWAVVTLPPGGLFPRPSSTPPPPLASASSVCPPGTSEIPPRPAITDPSRVSGGRLSFPVLGAPWKKPSLDNRLPFGNMGMAQEALDQENYFAGRNWVSSALVSDIRSGDGIASPQDGAEIVLRCALGVFYHGWEVKAQTISAGEHWVSGRPGWLIETQLTFDIAGLQAKGERVLLLAVQVEPDLYGVFFASIPDTQPARLAEARRTLDQLRVD